MRPVGQRTQLWWDLPLGDLFASLRHIYRVSASDHGRVIEDSTVEGVKERYGTQRTLVVDLVEPDASLEIDGVEVTRVATSRARHYRGAGD